MKSLPAEALIVLGHGKPHFLLHVHAILGCSSLNEGPVKEVPIVCDIHAWPHLNHINSCSLTAAAAAAAASEGRQVLADSVLLQVWRT